MGPARTAQLRELVAAGKYVPFAELRAKLGGFVPVVTDAALVKASRAAGPDPAKLAELERQREQHRATTARWRARKRPRSRPPPGPLGLSAYWRQQRAARRAQAAQ